MRLNPRWWRRKLPTCPQCDRLVCECPDLWQRAIKAGTMHAADAARLLDVPSWR
jgi:hypothetical protein